MAPFIALVDVSLDLLGVVLTLLPSYLGLYIAYCLTEPVRVESWSILMVQFAWCVMPVIFSFTVFSQYLKELNLSMFLILSVCIILRRIASPSRSQAQHQVASQHLSVITNLRSFLSICTVVAILAVDFNFFPKRHAKTKEFGYSLMDIGAPAYAVMMGLSNSRKRLRKGRSDVIASLKEVLVLFGLGYLRFVFTWMVDYKTPVKEYGTHCNFFFTLAALKFAGLLFKHAVPVRRDTPWFVLASTCTIIQQMISHRLQRWVFSEGYRTEFVEANKEWFVSILGYTALYLHGLSIGILVSNFRSKPFGLLKMSSMLLSTWLILLFTSEKVLEPPSRRLANATFICYVMVILMVFMTVSAIGETVLPRLVCGCSFTSTWLYKAISANMLILFLVANVATGLINMSINTHKVKFPYDFCIVTCYSFLLCVMVLYLGHRNVIGKIVEKGNVQGFL
ncbi:uncharacterized protein LOC143026084 isoform X2 [Oratosquilla oratoria]|uniref:uncharacterized protein LOC143026084 isoform X2 n=1 Tax=Oratosquilla oratoria TaxID=337810 RepID=UPI003F76E937